MALVRGADPPFLLFPLEEDRRASRPPGRAEQRRGAFWARAAKPPRFEVALCEVRSCSWSGAPTTRECICAGSEPAPLRRGAGSAELRGALRRPRGSPPLKPAGSSSWVEQDQPLGTLPLGHQTLVLDLTLERGRPYRSRMTTTKQENPDAPTGVFFRGELQFDIEIVATVDQAVPPRSSPELDGRVRRAISVACSRWTSIFSAMARAWRPCTLHPRPTTRCVRRSRCMTPPTSLSPSASSNPCRSPPRVIQQPAPAGRFVSAGPRSTCCNCGRPTPTGAASSCPRSTN